MKKENNRDNTKANSINNSTGNGYDGRYSSDNPAAAIPGINTPGIELPAFNPPIPNRAWTAMRMGADIDSLDEDEKRDLYVGRDELM